MFEQLTLKQRIRVFFDGKRKYKAIKNNKKKYFYASSLKQAQSKFTKWKISRVYFIK